MVTASIWRCHRRRIDDVVGHRDSSGVLAPVFEIAALIAVGLLLYRYHRQILASLSRFDARNRARQVEEIRDRYDALAHFRHTLLRAEEQIEAVTEIEEKDLRTGLPAQHYLFDGETYGSKEEAERERAEKVRALARNFYLDLPRALSARRDEDRLH